MQGPGHAAGRHLQDSSPGAPVVTVATTARQLQAAIASGAEHIEIRQHLDLTTLSILESDGNWPINQDDAILGAVPPSVKSIRARCHTAPAAGSFGLDENVPLRPLGPQQCLLVTDGDVMQVQGDLWLDGLYLRMRNTVRFPTPQLLLVRGPAGGVENSTAAGAPADVGGSNGAGGGMLWMSFCTVQGEQWSGSGGITGLQTFGNVHAQDCTFANLGGEVDAVEVRPPGAAAFSDSTFANNRITSPSAAVLAARGADARLRRTSFSANSGTGHLIMLGDAQHAPLMQHAGTVYSDEPREVCLEAALRSCERMGGAAGCVQGVASPVQAFPASEWPPTDPVLSNEDPRLQGTRTGLEPIYRDGSGRSRTPASPNSMGNCTPGGPAGSSFALSSSVTVAIACAATAAVVCALAAAILLFLRRRRRAPQGALHEQGKSAPVSSVLHAHL